MMQAIFNSISLFSKDQPALRFRFGAALATVVGPPCGWIALVEPFCGWIDGVAQTGLQIGNLAVEPVETATSLDS